MSCCLPYGHKCSDESARRDVEIVMAWKTGNSRSSVSRARTRLNSRESVVGIHWLRGERQHVCENRG